MKRKSYKMADKFVEKLLKDSVIRIYFEEERSKSRIALAIRSARIRAGLTQVELAKKIDTTQSVIARLESGEDQRTPSLALLSRIAAACHGTLELSFKFDKTG